MDEGKMGKCDYCGALTEGTEKDEDGVPRPVCGECENLSEFERADKAISSGYWPGASSAAEGESSKDKEQ